MLSLTTSALVKNRMDPLNEARFADYDALIDQIVLEVSADMQRRMARDLEEATHVEYQSADHSLRLLLDQGPLVSISEVGLVTDVENDTVDIMDAWRYRGRAMRDESHVGLAFIDRVDGARFHGDYRVTYVGGFVTVPPELEQAATTYAVSVFNRRDSSGWSQKTEGEIQVSPIPDENQWRAVDRSISNYRASGAY